MNSPTDFAGDCLQQLARCDDIRGMMYVSSGCARHCDGPVSDRTAMWPRGEPSGDEVLEAAEWLAGVAARDLGAPLTILRLMVEQHAGDGGNSIPALADQLEVLRDQLHRIEEVFRNLLAFAHPPELSPRVLSLNEVVQDMLDQFAPAASQRHLRPAAVLDASDPAVRADPDHFRQVCSTLLSTAMAAESGGSTVEVRTFRRNGSGELSIRHQIDGGTAIAPMLFSVDPRRSGGDLLRVWQAVRRQGGQFHMQVDSRRDRFFVVTLPLEETHGLPT